VKKLIFSVLTTVLLIAIPLVVVEGVYSLVSWKKPKRSISYQLLELAGFAGQANENIAAYKPYFANIEDLGRLLPAIKEGGVGIGSSPLDTVSTGSTIKTTVNGCPALKPNLHKVAFFLHSTANNNPFGSISVFHDADKKLDPNLEDFFKRYGGPRASLSSNAEGERLTLPDVQANRVVLVAGDSIAFGAMIDDSETIASKLQANDAARRYVNLGVPGVDAKDIICRLEDFSKRYEGRIDELIYVYCENDFIPGQPYGTPAEVIGWLKDFVEREKISKVAVVFAPVIYTVAPEITRIEGTKGIKNPRREKERAELIDLVKATGYRFVDIGALAREEEDRQKTHFGVLSFFVDTGHPSPLGTTRITEALETQD